MAHRPHVGTFVKLYGIVGLAFFFFSKHKPRFIASLAFWAVVMFVAPMLISSPDYVVSQYQEWYTCLTEKNSENLASIAQNISTLGLFRRISGCTTYSDLWILIPAVVMFLIPYLRLGQYRHSAFRQTILASVTMMVVLFSTGSESSGYIIPFVGIVVWYTAAPWQRNKWDVALLVFPYALKALPVTLIWLKLCYELYTRDYSTKQKAG